MAKKKTKRKTRTKSQLDEILIMNHIWIQRVKVGFSILISLACLVLIILPYWLSNLVIDQKTVGWIFVGASMVLASAQVKTIKDILNLK